jgi:hypothetical protein
VLESERKKKKKLKEGYIYRRKDGGRQKRETNKDDCKNAETVGSK